MTHTIIYSHGFGVRMDSRGLFTDIAAVLPECEHRMFDYNIFESDGTIRLRPLSDMAEMLNAKVAEAEAGVIDIVCHSLGGIVAAMAHPSGVRKIVLLAPPMSLSNERLKHRFLAREGSVLNMDGESILMRADGSKTLVPKEYWRDREALDVPALMNALSASAAVTVVTAAEDEILGSPPVLDPAIHTLSIPGDHNFSAPARVQLCQTVRDLVLGM